MGYEELPLDLPEDAVNHRVIGHTNLHQQHNDLAAIPEGQSPVKDNGVWVPRVFARKRDEDARNFGVVGDGSTDDRTALQAALNSGAATVHVPPNCVVSNFLLVPGSIRRIVGPGMGVPGIKAQNGATLTGAVLQASNRSDVEISDLHIDLNKDNTNNPANDAAGMAVYFSATDANGTRRCAVRRVRVTNGHRLGIRSSASSLEHPNEVLLDGCVVTGCGRMGMYFERVSSVRVNDCTLVGNTQDALFGSAQVQFSLGGQDASVRGCSVTDAGADSHGIAAAFVEGFEATGNYCARNDAAGELGWGIVASEDCTHVTISDNVCRDNGVGGVSVDPRTLSSEVLKDVRGTVSGNACTGNGIHGIFLNFARLVSVTGNICTGNAHSGVLAVARDCTFTGNVCADNTQYGLRVVDHDATSTDMGRHVIVGNRLTGNATANLSNAATLTSEVSANLTS